MVGNTPWLPRSPPPRQQPLPRPGVCCRWGRAGAGGHSPAGSAHPGCRGTTAGPAVSPRGRRGQRRSPAGRGGTRRCGPSSPSRGRAGAVRGGAGVCGCCMEMCQCAQVLYGAISVCVGVVWSSVSVHRWCTDVIWSLVSVHGCCMEPCQCARVLHGAVSLCTPAQVLHWAMCMCSRSWLLHRAMSVSTPTWVLCRAVLACVPAWVLHTRGMVQCTCCVQAQVLAHSSVWVQGRNWLRKQHVKRGDCGGGVSSHGTPLRGERPFP